MEKKEIQAGFTSLITANIDDVEIVSKLHERVHNLIKKSIAERDSNTNACNGNNWQACQLAYISLLKEALNAKLQNECLDDLDIQSVKQALKRLEKFEKQYY